jgi:ribosomal protein S18 acetylase RimI-like enzyme
MLPRPLTATSSLAGAPLNHSPKKLEIKESSPEFAPLDLLILADPSIERVTSYLQTGVLFIAHEGDTIVGAAIIEVRGSTAELMNIAVLEDRQHQGYGRAILSHVLDYACSHGVNSVTVGTGNSSLRQLTFYQRAGFRIVDVVKGFFDDYPSQIVEDGIRCRDMLILERKLNVVERGADGPS